MKHIHEPTYDPDSDTKQQLANTFHAKQQQLRSQTSQNTKALLALAHHGHDFKGSVENAQCRNCDLPLSTYRKEHTPLEQPPICPESSTSQAIQHALKLAQLNDVPDDSEPINLSPHLNPKFSIKLYPEDATLVAAAAHALRIPKAKFIRLALRKAAIDALNTPIHLRYTFEDE